MRAVDAFDTRLSQRPAECARGAVQAALQPPSRRPSTLLNLPVLEAPSSGPS